MGKEARARAALRAKAREERTIPENLDRLDLGERGVREESINAIHADEDLMDHVELLEAVMDHLDFHAVRSARSPDQETVQLLGTRMFNDLAAAYGQMLRGYYQISAMILRDVMEIVYLLGRFHRDHQAIEQWRKSDATTRMREFKPVAVRKFLDDYDGFKGQERGKAYDMFCEYAAHPTPAGFMLMGKSGGGPRTIGSFFDLQLLKAVLEEMAQLAAQAGNNFAPFFAKEHDLPSLETDIRRLEVTSHWAHRFLGRKDDHSDLAKLRRMLNDLKSD